MNAYVATVYATVDEPGAVCTTVDGQVDLEAEQPENPTGPWAAVWYEDETYADTCHASSADVYIAHYDWSLWFADVDHDCGRVDDFDPVWFAGRVREDLDHLGENGRQGLRAHALEFLDYVTRHLDGADLRTDPTLHAIARTIIDAAPRTETPVPVALGPQRLTTVSGDICGEVYQVVHDTVYLRMCSPESYTGQGRQLGKRLPVQIPIAAITATTPGAPDPHSPADS